MKRKPHTYIYIVIRWDNQEQYEVVKAFPSYGLAELWIIGQLDDYTYTIERCLY